MTSVDELDLLQSILLYFPINSTTIAINQNVISLYRRLENRLIPLAEREEKVVYSNEPIKYYKRRRTTPDPVIRWLELSSVLVWIIFLFDIAFILSARPMSESFFDRLFHVTVRNYWDVRPLKISLIISIIQFVVSIVSVYLNTRRMKRKYDTVYISNHISAAVSLILIIVLGIILKGWNA